MALKLHYFAVFFMFIFSPIYSSSLIISPSNSFNYFFEKHYICGKQNKERFVNLLCSFLSVCCLMKFPKIKISRLGLQSATFKFMKL